MNYFKDQICNLIIDTRKRLLSVNFPRAPIWYFAFLKQLHQLSNKAHRYVEALGLVCFSRNPHPSPLVEERR